MLHTFRRKNLKALNGVKNCLGNAATERRKQANINLCTFTHLYIYNYKYIYAHIHKKWHMAMRHSCQNNNNAQLTRRKYKNKKGSNDNSNIHTFTHIYICSCINAFSNTWHISAMSASQEANSAQTTPLTVLHPYSTSKCVCVYALWSTNVLTFVLISIFSSAQLYASPFGLH